MKKIILCLMVVILSGCTDQVDITQEIVNRSAKKCDKNDGVALMSVESYLEAQQVHYVHIRCHNGAVFKVEIKDLDIL